MLVQVTDPPNASGFGIGLGRQDWVAPGGNPLKLQVGAAAALGPLLVQVPETVTGCPAATDEGTRKFMQGYVDAFAAWVDRTGGKK